MSNETVALSPPFHPIPNHVICSGHHAATIGLHELDLEARVEGTGRVNAFNEANPLLYEE
jgi:hypothetical protein